MKREKQAMEKTEEEKRLEIKDRKEGRKEGREKGTPPLP